MFSEIALNLSPSVLAITVAVVFAASFARGYLGFGFSAIFMVGLLPFIPVSQLVPMSIALEILASSSQAPRILPDVHRRYLVVLLVASAIGVPGGVYLLSTFSEEVLTLTVYGVIFVSTLALLVSKPQPVSIAHPHLFAAGLVAGVVNGATALSGLVLALFFASSTVSSRTMRATMIAYLFFTDIITAGLLMAASLYNAETVAHIGIAIPSMLAGVWLGSRQFLKTPSDKFKTLVTWLLLGFCVIGVFQFL